MASVMFTLDDKGNQWGTHGLRTRGDAGGVVIKQVFNRRGENARRKHEAQSRSHVDNYRVCSAIVTKAVAIERTLHSASSFLDDVERDPGMPAEKSVLFSPQEGINGLFDGVAREILIEAIAEGFKVMEEIDDLRGEFAIIESPEQVASADELGDRTLDATGSLGIFARYPDASKEIYAIRDARDSLTGEARASRLATGSRM